MGEPRVAILPVLGASVRRALYETGSELTPTLMQLVGLAMGLLSQAYLGKLVDSAPNAQLGSYAGHFATFLLLGTAMLDLQNAIVGGLGQKIRQAQLQGSLEGLLATPTPPSLVLLALALPDVLLALGRMVIYAIAGRLVFGLRFQTVNPLGVLVMLAAAMAAFGVVALIGASLTMLLRRADPLNVLIAAASMIAGGVFYPRGILPHWAGLLGTFLPIAPVLDGLREAVVHSAGPMQLGEPLLRLGVMVLLVGPMAAWLFGRMLARARIDGSLTSY